MELTGELCRTNLRKDVLITGDTMKENKGISWHSARERDMHIDLKRAHKHQKSGGGRKEGGLGCEGGEG